MTVLLAGTELRTAVPAKRRMRIRDFEPEIPGASGRLRINIELVVDDRPLMAHGVGEDDLARVVDYEPIVVGTRRLFSTANAATIEILIEAIAGLCFVDRRVGACVVTIEHLSTADDLGSVGFEASYRRPENRRATDAEGVFLTAK